jgi:hypothetical protein
MNRRQMLQLAAAGVAAGELLPAGAAITPRITAEDVERWAALAAEVAEALDNAWKHEIEVSAEWSIVNDAYLVAAWSVQFAVCAFDTVTESDLTRDPQAIERSKALVKKGLIAYIEDEARKAADSPFGTGLLAGVSR